MYTSRTFADWFMAGRCIMRKNNTMSGIAIVNNHTYDEAELAECITNHGSYINDLTEDFIHHYLNKKDVTQMWFRIDMVSALQRITGNLCKEYEWIENIIPPFTYTRQHILDTADIEDTSLLIKDYLSMLYKRFDYYYPDNKSEMTQRVIRYVLGRPFEKHVLSEIAVFMGINHTYLSHSFKRDVGISFVDYCNHYKIDCVRMLLLYSDLSIKEIANKFKYDDKYMGRLFKNIVGVPPSRYRKNYKNL